MTPADSAHTHGRIVTPTFRPRRFATNAHLQTILPYFFRATPKVVLRRERIELDDGDFVDLGWSGGDSGPIAVLIHGLGGGFDSKYALGLMQRLNDDGWRTVLLQLRGAGPEPNRTAHCYHHGDTADFRHVCGLLRKREPETPLFGVGWSLGANILLKTLGEDGDDSLLQAACACSPPFLIEPCAEHLCHGVARLYQRSLLNAIKANLPLKHGPVALPPGADLKAALRARSFFEFDDAYTAPINGFRDARDYYRKASCGQFLHAIRRPTLIVHSLDDPMMVPEIVPDASQLAAPIRLELCRHGGHVGFMASTNGENGPWWMECRFARFLNQALAERCSVNAPSRPQSAQAATSHRRS